MSSEEPSIVLSIAALVAAVAALIFAALQTTAAAAQYVQVSSRCSERVTGVFNLKAGFWFHISSLSWNPQYRMPVLTMAALRRDLPAMEKDAGIPFRSGLNYKSKLNGYVDSSVLRVAAGRRREIKPGPTVIFATLAALWTPLGLALSTISLCLCLIPASCCECVCDGCGDGKKDQKRILRGLIFPLTWPWRHAIRYKSSTSTELSSSPGLEPAAWCQFLINYQATWWGHADIRWKWRLATMIPVDVYSATIETTMEDLRFFAALGGIYPSSEPGVLARTRCGEMLTLSHHPVLGRMVFYRSGRENINGSIASSVPRDQSAISCILRVRRYLRNKLSVLAVSTSNHETASQGIEDQERIAAVLSRPRTDFDLQLDCSVGNLAWVFDTDVFQKVSASIYVDGPRWKSKDMYTFPGPLGQGVNGCSCSLCCQQWWQKLREEQDEILYYMPEDLPEPTFWPALTTRDLQIGSDGPSSTTIKIFGPFPSYIAGQGINITGGLISRVQLEILKLCCGSCPDASPCHCGNIARIPQSDTEPSVRQRLVVTAINTQWLQKCQKTTLLAEVVDRFAADIARSRHEDKPQDINHSVNGRVSNTRTASPELIRAVLSSTEVHARELRMAFGSPDMWNGPLQSELEDFGPVVLGA